MASDPCDQTAIAHWKDLYEREKAAHWELEKERGEVNEALKAEMERAEKAEAALTQMRTDFAHEQAMHFKAETAADKLIKEKEAALAAARREIIQLRKDPQRALAAELLGEFEKAYADTESQMTDSDRVAARRFMDVVAALAAPAAGEERP